MINFLLVMAGGSVGSLGRLTVSSFIKRGISTEFPLATLLINAVSCFLLGMLVGAHASNFSQQLLGTGLIGGFSTFSTFELENVTLFQKKEYGKLALYLLASVGGGICLAILGLYGGNLLKG